MDIKAMTVEQLKAVAYDEMAHLQRVQQNLQALSQAIEKKEQEAKVVPPVPTKDKKDAV